MFDHSIYDSTPFQIFFGVFMMFALLVGLVVIGGLIGYVLLLPIAKKIKRMIGHRRLVKRFKTKMNERHEPVVWNDLHESFERTQEIVRPTFEQDMTALTPETHPGVAYLGGLPVEARHDKPDFLPLVTLMRHQI